MKMTGKKKKKRYKNLIQILYDIQFVVRIKLDPSFKYN